MEVTFAIEVKIPDVEVEGVISDEWGNVEVTISAGGHQARCLIDATGSDHGTISDALLSLAGIKIAKIDQRLSFAIPFAKSWRRGPCSQA